MTKTIKQTVTIGAPPKRVYEALISEKRHAAFTGAAASISRKVGGAFTCYGRYLCGINLDLVPGRRIVQAWRSNGWPKGVFSVATFSLSRARGGKTKLSFTQVGVPASSNMSISKGWRTYYWKPLRAYLED
jgi:activator of HSP90 ATPase